MKVILRELEEEVVMMMMMMMIMKIEKIYREVEEHVFFGQ